MTRTVTLQGDVLTLTGNELKLNQAAPDFSVVAGDMKDKKLSDFNGKIKLITTFPSIDTPICDLQVKEFDRRVGELPKEVTVLGISRDLPFAQSRFCKEYSIKKFKVYSDYKTGLFGMDYGLVIKELNLLARTVFILDKNNVVRYIQIADEISHQLDYDEAFSELAKIIRGE